MRQMTNSEYKATILNILTKVDKICRENNLKYSLCFGTLLGAVRHNGFIPWDDDIDIFMPRDDLVLLETVIRNSFPELTCISPNTNNETYFPFMKVCATGTVIEESTFKAIKGYGAYIDIFPFNYVPDNAIMRLLYRKYTRMVERVIQHSARISPSQSKSTIRKMLKIIAFSIAKLFDSHKLTIYLDKLMAKYPRGNWGGNPWGTIFRSNDYQELIEFDFEGHKFLGPKNYDNILRDAYGNYMELPPENERINKHYLICYLMD